MKGSVGVPQNADNDQTEFVRREKPARHTIYTDPTQVVLRQPPMSPAPPQAIVPPPHHGRALWLLVGVLAGIGVLAVLGAVCVVGALLLSPASATTTPNTKPVVGESLPTATAKPTATTRPTPPTISPTSTNGIGNPVSQAGYTLTVHATDYADSYGMLTPPDSESIYVACDVTIASTADRGVSANMLYGSLTDDTGKSYDVTFGGKEPIMPAENDIAQGRMVRGWFTFKIPRTARGLSFIYTPSLLTSDTRITVALDR